MNIERIEQVPAGSETEYPSLTSGGLRRKYVLRGLFVPGRIVFKHWETDRTLVGGAVPLGRALALASPPEVASRFFNERRELGILNTGGPGAVRVDGRRHRMGPLDTLYVGRGSRKVVFSSDDRKRPAQFYLLSYPAHARYPTRLARHSQASGILLGSPGQASARRLFKVIHPDGIRSCQLVMGFTRLEPGSVWNTNPPHTHPRRSEVYLYFGLPARGRITHFMGRPGKIRSFPVRDREAVLSPSWSIHSGAGTSDYTFVWGMGGENQDFADVDPVDPASLPKAMKLGAVRPGRKA